MIRDEFIFETANELLFKRIYDSIGSAFEFASRLADEHEKHETAPWIEHPGRDHMHIPLPAQPRCYGCGVPIDVRQTDCPFCGSKVATLEFALGEPQIQNVTTGEVHTIKTGGLNPFAK